VNDVIVKHIDDVTTSDHVSFKIIDLDDITNLKAIHFGAFIWLQVISKSDDSIT